MVLHPIRFHPLCISGVHFEIWSFLPTQLNSVTHCLCCGLNCPNYCGPFHQTKRNQHFISLLSSIILTCCWVDCTIFLLLILFLHVESTFPASFSTSSSPATTSCLCPGFTSTSLTYFRPQSCCAWIGNAFALYTCVQCDHSVFLTPFGGCLAGHITICARCSLSLFTPVLSCRSSTVRL